MADKVWFDILLKSDEDIAKLKRDIFNGDEAERLAKLRNLNAEDSEIQIMVSHISRAIVDKEMAEMQEADETTSGEAVCMEPPEISLSPTVETIFDNVKEYEQVCSKSRSGL